MHSLIPLEKYLRTNYEPDAEFVDGEIVERHLGENPHSAAQVRLIQLFTPLSQNHDLHLRTELRMRLSPTRVCIPDFAVFVSMPTELVPSTPLLLVVGSHSSRGIMTANWNGDTLRLADQGRLRFTPKQARHIRRNVERRCNRRPGLD